MLFNRGFYVVTFLYIWTLLTLYYYVRFFIACSASVWYYSRDKNYLNAPILRPMCYGFFYHIGSFLFGYMLLVFENLNLDLYCLLSLGFFQQYFTFGNSVYKLLTEKISYFKYFFVLAFHFSGFMNTFPNTFQIEITYM